MLQIPIALECAVCHYRWISKPRSGRAGNPLYCANPLCRSSRWTGRPDARFNPFRTTTSQSLSRLSVVELARVSAERTDN